MADIKRRAHMAVFEAVRAGTMPSPASQPCARCGGAAVLYHHHSGYGGALDFAVEALCYPCHHREHPRARRASAPVLTPTPPRPPREKTTILRGRILPDLRAWRDRRAMTQEELAMAAGVAEATVSRLETARYAARPKTVKALAEALAVTPGQLYGETTE